MGILIKRSVAIKVVVTEEFKSNRTAELTAALAKLDTVKKRLEFELDSLGKRSGLDARAAAGMTERLKAGLRNNDRAKSALVEELEKLSAVEIGAEYDRGTVDGLVEVDVGDDFSKIASCEVVVRDDKIVEIRDACSEQSGTSP